MTISYRIGDGSCALLIGASAYESPEFPIIPAAHNSLMAMESILSDPELCGWRPDSIKMINDPSSVRDLGLQITTLARKTTDVLLIYYVGHGVLSNRGELYLTVTTTLFDHPKITGLPWIVVADALRESPARMRCAILDCCFAGQAIEAMGEGPETAVANISHVEGVYTLTATTRNQAAHVPPLAQQSVARTSFTSNFVDLLKSGIADGPEELTFGTIYPYLRARLSSSGLPLPNQRNTDLGDKFVFARNVAAHLSVNAADALISDSVTSHPAVHAEGTSAPRAYDEFAAQVFLDIANDDSRDIEDRLEAVGRLGGVDSESAADILSEIVRDDSIDASDRLGAAERLMILDIESAADICSEIACDDSIHIDDRLDVGECLANIDGKLAVAYFYGMAHDASLELEDRREAAARLGVLDVSLGAETLSAIAISEQNTLTFQIGWPRSRRAVVAAAVVCLAVLALAATLIANFAAHA